jgi:hypothetical protein
MWRPQNMVKYPPKQERSNILASSKWNDLMKSGEGPQKWMASSNVLKECSKGISPRYDQALKSSKDAPQGKEVPLQVKSSPKTPTWLS